MTLVVISMDWRNILSCNWYPEVPNMAQIFDGVLSINCNNLKHFKLTYLNIWLAVDPLFPGNKLLVSMSTIYTESRHSEPLYDYHMYL